MVTFHGPEGFHRFTETCFESKRKRQGIDLVRSIETVLKQMETKSVLALIRMQNVLKNSFTLTMQRSLATKPSTSR